MGSSSVDAIIKLLLDTSGFDSPAERAVGKMQAIADASTGTGGKRLPRLDLGGPALQSEAAVIATVEKQIRSATAATEVFRGETEKTKSSLRGLAGELGKGSEFTLWTKTLMGGGALLGVSLAAGAVERAMDGLTGAFNKGGMSANEFTAQLAYGIPIIGGLIKSSVALADAIENGETRALAAATKAMREHQAALAEMGQKQTDARELLGAGSSFEKEAIQARLDRDAAQKELDKKLNENFNVGTMGSWQTASLEVDKTYQAKLDDIEARELKHNQKLADDRRKRDADTAEKREAAAQAEEDEAERLENFLMAGFEERAKANQAEIEANEKWAAGLREIAETAGMTAVELLRYEAAKRGIGADEEEELERLQRATDARKAYADKLQEGQRVFDETRTPMERYQARLDKLSDLLTSGALDYDAYVRAVQQAGDAAEKAQGHSAAASWGGVESAMATFDRISNAAATFGADDAKATARNTAKLMEIEERARIDAERQHQGHMAKIDEQTRTLRSAGGLQ